VAAGVIGAITGDDVRAVGRAEKQEQKEDRRAHRIDVRH
jgi:hypothetical protein